MSNSIKIATASFTKVLTALSLPARTDLAGEYILGGSFAASSRNLANPAAPLTVQGSPTYNANSVIVQPNTTGGFGFNTGLSASMDWTLLAIRKHSTNGQGVIIGNDSVNMSGLGQFGSNNKFYHGTGDYSLGATRTAPAAGSFYFEAGATSYLGTASLYYYSAGVQQVATSAGVGGNHLTNVYIGSTGLANGGAYDCEVAYVAFYNRKLTAAEIEIAYQSLKVFFALKGIAI
jgi:hypothetical protein